LQLERIGEEDAEPTSICSKDVHKADIQQLVLRKINETEGFIMWLEFSRLPNAQGYDFLMLRPPMLLKLDEEMHEHEDQAPEAVNPRAPVEAKLAKYAREIASVSRKVLQRVEDGVYTRAEVFDNRPILQITDEFKRGVINNAEFEWFNKMSTGASVIDNLRSVQAHERSQEWVWARLSRPDASRLLAIQRNRKSRDESIIEHFKNLLQRMGQNVGPLDVIVTRQGNANPAAAAAATLALLVLTSQVRLTEYAQFATCIVAIYMGQSMHV